MSFTPLKLDAVTLATIAAPATPTDTFGGIKSAGIEANQLFFTEAPAGHPAPTVAALAKIAPRVTFQTPSIDIAVNGLTSWGKQCSARLWQKDSSGAAPKSRAGTTNSYKSVASAVAFWTNIMLPQPRQGQCGYADVTLLAAYNGSVNPIVNNAAAALLSTALDAVNFYAAGPVYVNETLVAGVQSIQIANQVELTGEGDADSIFDTYVQGTIKQLVVTITTLSQYSWVTALASGLAMTDLTFFARKWQDGGLVSFVADGTAEHIKFQATNCVAAPVSSVAQDQGLFLDTFQICVAAEDAATPPLTSTINQAIAAP